MKKIIHSIRNKPDHVKTRLVFIFAILATVIVVVVWIITLRLLKTPDDTIKTDGPVKVFREIFKSNVSTVKEQTENKKNPLDLLKPEDQASSEIITEDVTVDSSVIIDSPVTTTTTSDQINIENVQQ